ESERGDLERAESSCLHGSRAYARVQGLASRGREPLPPFTEAASRAHHSTQYGARPPAPDRERRSDHGPSRRVVGWWGTGGQPRLSPAVRERTALGGLLGPGGAEALRNRRRAGVGSGVPAGRNRRLRAPEPGAARRVWTPAAAARPRATRGRQRARSERHQGLPGCPAAGALDRRGAPAARAAPLAAR